MRDRPATKERPMFSVCCENNCETIYGCYDGETTKTCAACREVVICYKKFLYKKEPASFPMVSHGICQVHLETAMSRTRKFLACAA